MSLENNLIKIAECDPDDNRANRAMRILRERYDKSYVWCIDCDDMVVKEKECCLNIKPNKENNLNPFDL